MSLAQSYYSRGGMQHPDYRPSSSFKNHTNGNRSTNWNDFHAKNFNSFHYFSGYCREPLNNFSYVNLDGPPSLKKRKISASTWGESSRHYRAPIPHENAPSSCNNPVIPLSVSDAGVSMSTSCKRARSQLEDDEEVALMSRNELERCSPSRKDGIDALCEAHLRYSYCAFLQNLGMQLQLPQTTIGTAMVLCHRFFVRRSHVCHDRFLIATAALFLASKYEETACSLNNVLQASCEVYHKQDITFLSYLLPIDWFEQYRERVIEAEQMILTTLNFELSVQHPYDPLTSILSKLGLSRTVLVNLALSLVSEGLRSSLWLQFKPHHIAAGAAYLAAKFLNQDLSSYRDIWQEFETPPAILEDVVQQFMELF